MATKKNNALMANTGDQPFNTAKYTGSVGLTPSSQTRGQLGDAQYSPSIYNNGVTQNLYGSKYDSSMLLDPMNQVTLSPTSPTMPVQEAGYTSLAQANSALRSTGNKDAQKILQTAINKYVENRGIDPEDQGMNRLISPELATNWANGGLDDTTGGGGGGGNYGVATPTAASYFGMAGSAGSGGWDPLGNYTPYGAYSPSQEALAAAAQLAAAENSKPGAYQSKYQEMLDTLTDQILGRGKFSYDFNADPMYQLYRDRYTQQAKEGMRDAMGQAAALTGGYGSSYGQQVGQQTYNKYMSALNDMIPELRQQAYNEWLNEGNDLYNKANFVQGRDETDYGRYRDTYNDYLTDRNYYNSKYTDARNFDWNQYDANRNYDFNLQAGNFSNKESDRNYDLNDRKLQLDYMIAAANAAKEGIALPSLTSGMSGSTTGTTTGNIAATAAGNVAGTSAGSSTSSSKSSSSSSKSGSAANAAVTAYNNGASFASIYSSLTADLMNGRITQKQYNDSYKALQKEASKKSNYGRS